MKKLTMVCVFLTFLTAQTSNAQSTKNQQQPDERVEVNKKYDENGNLIQYDSIYSYSSSSGNLKMHSKKLDSLMKNFFPKEFASLFPEIDTKSQNTPFGFLQRHQNIDSLWKQRMEMHRKMIEKYFKQTFPNEKEQKPFKKQKI
ncbi:hypothetical protein U8527_13510 [Kordia algicida OT-1]|uniref:Uncharacterized protein n=1 Tax=Kordia algicida OT-1 TaxID=391587 RepID=A9DWK7_9FLAO|nr:hypothetical protein [Kordia algicida]EDP95915.1 hypothetical protein KAOT1_07098 [Kordia algicida OT-1]